LRDEQGRLTRWYAAATDIEDRKQAEQILQNENIALREEIDKTSMFKEIVGNSGALQTVLSRVSKVAPTDSSVLITGETGTGKELVARAIHRHSRRCSCAFVSVNCAAIPRDLIASELFGHEKGAFTGATQRRSGRFELAGGGTIFLDEVGELPAETQIALLRVLQEHEFERVGGTGSIKTDVRVIEMSLAHLQSYPWPGNIRELQNVIERSVIVCETENFSVDESWLSRKPLATGPTSQPELSQRLTAHEKELIEAALSESGGRVFGASGAAARLGMPRTTLESKIRSLKIDKKRYKTTHPSL
jgi:transcriptional regulator with GAF, ATPase, and Fis domain